MNYKNTLENTGTVVINQQDSPLSPKERSDLEKMYDGLDYEYSVSFVVNDQYEGGGRISCIGSKNEIS